MAIGIGGLVLWIFAIVELVRYPDATWYYAQKDKTTWLLIVILVGAIGALVYWFSVRKALKATEEWLAQYQTQYQAQYQAQYPPAQYQTQYPSPQYPSGEYGTPPEQPGSPT